MTEKTNVYARYRATASMISNHAHVRRGACRGLCQAYSESLPTMVSSSDAVASAKVVSGRRVLNVGQQKKHKKDVELFVSPM